MPPLRAVPVVVFLLLAASSGASGQDRDLADPVATIDRILEETWEREGLEPSAPAGDAELHRRLWLDVAGVVPSRADTEAYLSDASAGKADRLARRLLDSPEYSRHWALAWQGALIGRTGGQGGRGLGDDRLLSWLEEQIRTNRPYDEMAYDLLAADGYVPANFPPAQLAQVAAEYEGVEIDTGPSPIQYMAQFADNRAFSPPTAVGNTAKVFLGMRIECAECHDHPWEKWTQKDFQGMEAFFKRTAARPLPNPPTRGEGKDQKRMVIAYVGEEAPGNSDRRARMFEMMMDGEKPAELERFDSRIAEIEKGLASGAYTGREKTRSERELERLREVRAQALARFEEARKRLLANPNTKDLAEAMTYTPRFILGPSGTGTEVAAEDLRDDYGRRIVSNVDGQFARAIANRLWAHYLGRGVVHPFDDMRESNPAAIPELLEFLARLIAHLDYDVKAFTRILLSTRAYRLSSIANETNREDEVFYSRRILTPLSPEQTAFSLLRVRSESSYRRLDEGLSALGRIVRQFVVALDDDEGTEVSDFTGTIPKSLFMMNAEQMNGLPDVGLRFDADPVDLVDQLYVTVLARRPTPEEEFLVGNYLAETDPLPAGWQRSLRGDPANRPPRLKRIEDVYWALLNSAEFTYNH